MATNTTVMRVPPTTYPALEEIRRAVVLGHGPVVTNGAIVAAALVVARRHEGELLELLGATLEDNVVRHPNGAPALDGHGRPLNDAGELLPIARSARAPEESDRIDGA